MRVRGNAIDGQSLSKSMWREGADVMECVSDIRSASVQSDVWVRMKGVLFFFLFLFFLSCDVDCAEIITVFTWNGDVSSTDSLRNNGYSPDRTIRYPSSSELVLTAKKKKSCRFSFTICERSDSRGDCGAPKSGVENLVLEDLA